MKAKVYCGLSAGVVVLLLLGPLLVSASQVRHGNARAGVGIASDSHPAHAVAWPWQKIAKAIWDQDRDTGIQAEESSDEDWLRFDVAGREIMVIDEAGNVGIGESPPNDAKLHVKSPMLGWQAAIHGEGAYGVRGVSNAWEGTGITGEGGHAGVAGNGFIGILGSGFYGGWFEGHGVFSGNLGVGVADAENRLHVNGAVNLDPVAEPSSPTTGFVLYCDAADGRLKAKSSAGTISVLADG